jgi:membrane-bound lytic murein transglycosylase D
MNIPWTLTLAIALSALSSADLKAYPHISEKKSRPGFSETFIHWRCQQMDLPFTIAPFRTRISRHVRHYLTTGRRDTERLLGRAAFYLPVFEQFLREHNLPDALKYVPVIESRLEPGAVSEVGAAGLWQFMPATARYYKLKINEIVDERLDPYRSTEAAMRLFSSLFEEFGDWSLVLAAYNCGPARVRKAMRQTGCANLADILHLLPRQTQRYIPALIAAIYIVENHKVHNLNPLHPGSRMGNPEMIRVHRRLSFNQIAELGEVSLRNIRKLNPTYLQEVIPSSPKGNVLVLPRKAAERVNAWLLNESDQSRANSRLNSNKTVQSQALKCNFLLKLPMPDIDPDPSFPEGIAPPENTCAMNWG